MTKFIKPAILAIAASGMLAGAVPAGAAVQFDAAPAAHVMNGAESAWQHHKRGHHKGWNGRGNRGDYDGYQGNRSRVTYDEPVYANTRVWRGDDGRNYCRRSNGTTGLLIGGAAGALLGREIAGRRGDRTLGAILGAAGGALLGREVDRSGSSCR